MFLCVAQKLCSVSYVPIPTVWAIYHHSALFPLLSQHMLFTCMIRDKHMLSLMYVWWIFAISTKHQQHNAPSQAQGALGCVWRGTWRWDVGPPSSIGGVYCGKRTLAQANLRPEPPWLKFGARGTQIWHFVFHVPNYCIASPSEIVPKSVKRNCAHGAFVYAHFAGEIGDFREISNILASTDHTTPPQPHVFDPTPARTVWLAEGGGGCKKAALLWLNIPLQFHASFSFFGQCSHRSLAWPSWRCADSLWQCDLLLHTLFLLRLSHFLALGSAGAPSTACVESLVCSVPNCLYRSLCCISISSPLSFSLQLLSSVCLPGAVLSMSRE